MRISKVCDGVINYSFYALFFLVPLIWLPFNFELFEFNKMLLVYLLTTIITASWLLKSLSEKSFVIKRTPLDIPILLFLAANILSTIFSIDPHTSIFGYYGRFHGGLLSTISYIILYYAFVSTTTKRESLHYLFTLLFSSFLVAVYGVLQHPNPLFQEKLGSSVKLHGIDYNYWAVDVEDRVFSTLGQPNWLAAFLSMTIFPAISFLFIFKKNWQKLLVLVAIVASYLAFTFTYSRGGLVGFLVGVLSSIIVLPFYKKKWWRGLLQKLPLVNFLSNLKHFKEHYLAVLALIIVVVSTNIYFNNALAKRGGISTNPTTNTKQNYKSAHTELEFGGQQSAQIRTIVWKGSLEIFKHFPILGSGVETFGYSYYLFRPVENNLTNEWDYIYNKAHNEYINYLATTGAFGFATYLLLIGLFELLIVRYIIFSKWSAERLLAVGLFAGYNSYLAQNFFGFSVVPIGLLFYLYPAVFLVLTETLSKKEVHLEKIKALYFLKESFFNFVARGLIILLAVATLTAVGSMWAADYFYNRSVTSNNYEESVTDSRIASSLAPYEPIYRAELAQNLSGLAYGLSQNKAETERFTKAKQEAREIIDKVVAEHQNNISLWETKRVVDFNLARVDKANNLDLLATAAKLKVLAPTDASIQYEIALIYEFVEDYPKAEDQLAYVVKIKPDYRDATLDLVRVYAKNKKFDKALKLLRGWIDKNPNDTDANDLLKTLLSG